MNEFFVNASVIDPSSINGISNLDEMLRSLPDWKSLDVHTLKTSLSETPEISQVIIGLWSFDFLKKPTFNGTSLVGYNQKLINKTEQSYVIEGLISVIRNCRVDQEEDGDAIDFHYAACGKLFRLTNEDAEKYVVEDLKRKPTYSNIEAIGVLVGNEYQGKIEVSTIELLKKMVYSDSANISLSARNVLINDVNRVNAYKKFLEHPIQL
jgi:hypothetical protein